MGTPNTHYKPLKIVTIYRFSFYLVQ